MGTWLPETCTEQEINIHEKELYVRLVIYKDYKRDTPSTKHKVMATLLAQTL